MDQSGSKVMIGRPSPKVETDRSNPMVERG